MASEDTDLEGAVGGINFDRQENRDLGLKDQIFEDLINLEMKLSFSDPGHAACQSVD